MIATIDAPVIVETRPADEPPTCHGPDFASVLWRGRLYFFSRTQAKVVAQLWAAWQAGYLAVRQDTLMKGSGSYQTRLRDLFARGGHPAWGTMIVASDGLRGGFQLNVEDGR